jgi:hypothetical protein
MYTTSQAFKDKARSNGRSAKGYVVIDGVIYEDSSTGRLDGFDFEYLSDSFIGGFSAKCLVVRLNIQGIESMAFRNKSVSAYIGFEGAEFIPIGIFKVDEDGIETDDLNKTVKLTCYDSATKFDTKYSSSITYPCSFREFIQDICDNTGVTLDTKVLMFDSLILTEKPNMDELISNREIVSQYAQANLSMAYISRDNKLAFATVFDDSSTGITIDGYDYDSIILEKIQGPLNGLVLARSPQNDNVYVQNDASVLEYGLKQVRLENNIFLDDRRETVISLMLTKILAFVYRPFSLSYFALPYIDPGDILEVSGLDDNSLPAPVSDISFSYVGSLLGKLKTSILPETLIQYPLPSVEQRLANAEIKVDKVNLDILSTVGRVDGLESRSSEIEQTINGVTITVNQHTDQINDAQSTINQNSSDIEDSNAAITEQKTYYNYSVTGLTVGKSDSPAQIKIGYDAESKPEVIITDGYNETTKIKSNSMTSKNIVVGESLIVGNHKQQKLTGSDEYTIFLPI